MNISDTLLEWVAPKAKAEFLLGTQFTLSYLVVILENSHKLKSKTESEARFRVAGNFFANLKTTKLYVGLETSPEHYMKCGFNLIVRETDSKQVYLFAEERVIFGWLEKKAISISLDRMLRNLAKELNGKRA